MEDVRREVRAEELADVLGQDLGDQQGALGREHSGIVVDAGGPGLGEGTDIPSQWQAALGDQERVGWEVRPPDAVLEDGLGDQERPLGRGALKDRGLGGGAHLRQIAEGVDGLVIVPLGGRGQPALVPLIGRQPEPAVDAEFAFEFGGPGLPNLRELADVEQEVDPTVAGPPPPLPRSVPAA